MMDDSPPGLDPAVRSYYERRPEEDRLERGLSQLEAVRTRALIQRHAPPPPGVVLDVGGAAGAYAIWLAEAGYTVHLVDPVPRLVDEARRRGAVAARPLASCTVGDARGLEFPDGCADVVLLLGPLYHLTEADERARALAEAARVLAPGGLLFAAAISRFAGALDGLRDDLFADPAFARSVDQELRDGQHRNPTERVGYFTTAYFHRPEELRAEIARADLVLEALCGVEGPARMLDHFEERWADPRRRADMVRLAETLQAEPSLLGMSPHLLAVARKPLPPASR